MKNRKQQTLQQKSARQQPTKRGAAQRRQAGARRKATPAKPAQRRVRDDGSLTLGAECTVAEADTLKSELACRLAESGTVTVDVTALQRIDTAGLQLLAAFVRDRRTAGRMVAWRGRSAALDAAAGLLGLDSMLELQGEACR
ncbi:MAG TPA: STAS domain-containing protein [Steroidobacteraceae bacterium]|jgi:ABC-type transporter Mla MlaB component